MNENELCRLRLDIEMEAALAKYLKDRRSVMMTMLCITGFLSVVLAPFAIAQLQGILNGSYIVYRRGYRRYTLIGIWIFAIVQFVVLFIQGIGKAFGPGSDFDCLKKQKYGFGTMVLGGKKHDAGKHPYYVCDREENEYICPVYLDYKNTNFGDEMFCVVLDNGKRYAFSLNKKPWWDME